MQLKHKRSFFVALLVIIAAFMIGTSKFSIPFWSWKFSWQNSTINQSFRESLMSITPTQGDILEVATLDSNETLTRMDSKSLFDNAIYLGTTVSEIRVKVTYRYHIKLLDNWDISARGNTLTVVAPQIYPSLPPAIHTEDMEKRSDAGWLRFNADENLQKLEQSLTPTLSQMSLTPAKIALVQGAAKHAIEEFVRKWILSQDKWKDSTYDAVVIRFPGETVNRN